MKHLFVTLIQDCVFKENKDNTFVSGSWECKTIMPKIRNKKQQKKKSMCLLSLSKNRKDK